MTYFKVLSILLLISVKIAFAQEVTEKTKSLKLELGLGFFEGDVEMGTGIAYTIGYQKSFWKNRLRLSPNLTFGGFTPIMITDTPEQFFRISMLSTNVYLDVIKYKAVSLYIGTGAFTMYSRGLMGTGGYPPGRTSSEYFYKLYFGGNLNGGIRIDRKNKKRAFEFSPFNINFGQNYLVFAYWKLGWNLKL